MHLPLINAQSYHLPGAVHPGLTVLLYHVSVTVPPSCVEISAVYLSIIIIILILILIVIACVSKNVSSQWYSEVMVEDCSKLEDWACIWECTLADLSPTMQLNVLSGVGGSQTELHLVDVNGTHHVGRIRPTLTGVDWVHHGAQFEVHSTVNGQPVELPKSWCHVFFHP